MAYDTLPIHGNPDGGVFGVIGERVSSDVGVAYVKLYSDTLNVGWGNMSIEPSPTPSITPNLTPTITPSITPTVTQTPTITPTVTQTPTITPTVTQTPTITPTQTVTPTVTLTTGLTPTPTPTITPTPITYYTLYTTSSVASYGSLGEAPGSLSIGLSPPGGVYASGTTVTIYATPNSNSSASLYKDGILYSTANSLITTTMVMDSHHTASIVVGWRNVRWQLAATPALGGSPYGPSGLTASFAKKGEIITINANPIDSTFVSWSYSNSPPTSITNTSSLVTLSNDGVHQFTANYTLNTFTITANYSGTTGTASFSYYDQLGDLQAYFGSGTPGGTVTPQCGVLVNVFEGTANQTPYPC